MFTNTNGVSDSIHSLRAVSYTHLDVYKRQAFAGALAVTSTSGPGVCLKSEAMNLAVITELPLVVLDVHLSFTMGDVEELLYYIW